MNEIRSQIAAYADQNHIQLIYAFGSRAREIQSRTDGIETEQVNRSSDLDIGVKAKIPMDLDSKVRMAIFFEDLFDLPKVDVVDLQEAPVFLALEIVEGELLYACDDYLEAEYQLYVMRRAAELFPFERQVKEAVFGEGK
ncbi:MAG: nucleotidyltransferase domain-containing protein [Candidatus Aminicenantes bacterium]|nr:nucleotidyltransferase domain-containing protein [Candidatus Aminicenantes bacterium]